jgi:hypothetical protein
MEDLSQISFSGGRLNDGSTGMSSSEVGDASAGSGSNTVVPLVPPQPIVAKHRNKAQAARHNNE